MSTSLAPFRRRARLAALCLAWAAWAAGCGPGVGGTGTGETADALRIFGASAAALCTSELATVLACPADGTAAIELGSALVFFADAVVDRHVLVRVEGNEIEFDDACARFRFRGEWGAIAGKPGRFYGVTDPDGRRIPATLEIVIGADGLRLTVRDLSGALLLGPLVLRATPASGAAASC